MQTKQIRKQLVSHILFCIAMKDVERYKSDNPIPKAEIETGLLGCSHKTEVV